MHALHDRSIHTYKICNNNIITILVIFGKYRYLSREEWKSFSETGRAFAANCNLARRDSTFSRPSVGSEGKREAREWNSLLLRAKTFRSTAGILKFALLIAKPSVRNRRMRLKNGRLTSSPSSSTPLLFVQEGILHQPFRHSATEKARKDKRRRFVIGGRVEASLPSERAIRGTSKRRPNPSDVFRLASFGYLVDFFPLCLATWSLNKRMICLKNPLIYDTSLASLLFPCHNIFL